MLILPIGKRAYKLWSIQTKLPREKKNCTWRVIRSFYGGTTRQCCTFTLSKFPPHISWNDRVFYVREIYAQFLASRCPHHITGCSNILPFLVNKENGHMEGNWSACYASYFICTYPIPLVYIYSALDISWEMWDDALKYLCASLLLLISFLMLATTLLHMVC